MRDRFLAAVAGSIARHRLLRARDSVLVAVSGGPDSVALLAALVALGDGRWRIGVGHVNHHLRGLDSDSDAAFVARLAARLGCEAYTADGRLSGPRNLEERAREMRYGLLTEIARREGFRRIATGHTLDDQAETVLHRVSRGSGLGGLGGISPERADGVIRPLLERSRREIVEFLKERRLRFRRDVTNRDPRFTRNRVRHRVIPFLERELNPSIRQALARLADLVREDELVLERQAARRLRGLNRDGALLASGLARLPVALQRRVVRLWLGVERGDLRSIELDHVEGARHLAAEERGEKRLSLPGGSITRSGDWLRWSVETPTATQFRARLEPGALAAVGGWRLRARVGGKSAWPGPLRAVFDLAALNGKALGIRSPRPGDRIQPLGLGGTKKLQDVFVDAKVPRGERAAWPIVTHGRAILWVPGLVRAEAARIHSGTRRVLVVEAEPPQRGEVGGARCRTTTYVLPSDGITEEN